MPSLLTTRPEWSELLQVPADGDLADESSLRAPFQQLANSARWLRDFILLHGVFAIRGAADIAALKAIANPVNGQVAYVYGRGIYAFLDGPARAEDPPWIIAPAGGGTGRWYHPLANLLSGARSFVTTNAQNKIGPELITNGLIAVLQQNQTGFMAASLSRPTEVVGFTLTPKNVRVGDVFHVDWSGKIRCTQAASWGGFFPVVTDSGQDNQLNGIEVRITQHPNFQNTSFHVGTVWTAMTTAVAFKANMVSGGGDAFLDGGEIRCLHFRP